MDGTQLLTVAVATDPTESARTGRRVGYLGKGYGSRIRDTDKLPALSVVVPVYNEVEVLSQFYQKLAAVLKTLDLSSEIIFVNDGSTDLSLFAVRELQATDGRVAAVNLSRNFGKHAAVMAGLDYAHGDAIVVIDADLQDPPELIPRLLDKWHEGYDVVYARRRDHRGGTWFKRTTTSVFYRIFRHICDVPIPENTGDFRLLNRRCLEAVTSCRERGRFMTGLFAWVGFKQSAIIYDRAPRFGRRKKSSYWRLMNLAIDGITSFTIAPLKLATYFGLITALIAVAYAAYIFCRTLVLGREVPGYASLMIAILFLSGVQLVAMGVIGEYVGRILAEAKGRPLYVLDAYLSASGLDGSPVSDSATSCPLSEGELRNT